MGNLTQKLFIFTALNISYLVVRLKQLDPMYQKVYILKKKNCQSRYVESIIYMLKIYESILYMLKE